VSGANTNALGGAPSGTGEAPALPSERARPAQKSGVVIPQRLKWHGELAAFFIWILIRAFSMTWRITLTGKLPGHPAPVIFAIWHNRLAVCMRIYDRFGVRHWPAPGLAALISASRDGALLSRVLKYFGVKAVRGSSSRRGRQALLELTRLIDEGCNAAITPDGPKGPKYKIQEGIIALAQVTGAAIIPVSVTVSSKWTTRSWDGFQIPRPFSRCEIYVNEALRVPREASEGEREALRAELERRMMEITFD
jgi:lysophospholipid acyltransferase (LPLAT)-like uncharacterized protein